LRYDDILREETDIIREAINRLPEEELYGRVFRMKQGFQYSLSHTIATPDKKLKPEDDIRYLTPVIDEVAAEFAEREDFNVMYTAFDSPSDVAFFRQMEPLVLTSPFLLLLLLHGSVWDEMTITTTMMMMNRTSKLTPSKEIIHKEQDRITNNKKKESSARKNGLFFLF